MAARRVKTVEEIDAESLFAQLVASVRTPEPLVVVPGKLVATYPPARQLQQLLTAVSVDAQIRAVFWDNYEVAEELFGGQPIDVWNGFMKKYNEHMFGDKDGGK